MIDLLGSRVKIARNELGVLLLGRHLVFAALSVFLCDFIFVLYALGVDELSFVSLL